MAVGSHHLRAKLLNHRSGGRERTVTPLFSTQPVSHAVLLLLIAYLTVIGSPFLPSSGTIGGLVYSGDNTKASFFLVQLVLLLHLRLHALQKLPRSGTMFVRLL